MKKTFKVFAHAAIISFTPVLVSSTAIAQLHIPAQHTGCVLQGAKGTTVGSRLIATWVGWADTAGSYTFMDSSILHYPDNTTAKYDLTNHFVYNGASYDTLDKSLYAWSPQGFVNLPVLNYDWAAPADYRYVDSSTFTLDPHGNFADAETYNWDPMAQTFDKAYRMEWTYNIVNAVTTNTYEYWNHNASTWANNIQFQYTYNSQHKITAYSLVRWDNFLQDWAKEDKTSSKYDASGLTLLSDTTLIGNSQGAYNTWVNSQLKIYTNDNTGRALYNLNYYWDGSIWILYGKTSYTYDGAGNLTTATNTQYYNGAYSNQDRTVYTYNSYNQLTTSTTQHWVNGQWTLLPADAKYIYYYGSYSPTTIVSLNESPGAVLVVSPNPAANTIQINIVWNDVQALSGNVTDIYGHIVKQFSAAPAKNTSLQLNISDLNAGNYMLHIKGAHENEISRIISVIH